jgi:mono/diheme cytochrome c family protein
MNSLFRCRLLFVVISSLAVGYIVHDLASAMALRFRPIPADGTSTVGAVFAAGSGGGSRASARSNYLWKCATCHGDRGRGDGWTAWLFRLKAGDFTNPSSTQALSDDSLFQIIKHGGASLGKPGMPSWGHELTDQEIRELVIYIRSLAPPPKQPQPRGSAH